jgi:phosphoenolpyruvate carboxylase
MSTETKKERLAIYRMLAAIEKFSRGGDPRWYARGFYISMASSLAHIQAAAHFQRAVFGSIRLPIIPLFEEASSLARSDQTVSEFVKDPALKKAAIEYWDGMIEMMVGYSDSSKEAGVLASRLAISEALPKLEKVCEKAKLTPVFFMARVEASTVVAVRSKIRRHGGRPRRFVITKSRSKVKWSSVTWPLRKLPGNKSIKFNKVLPRA